MSDRHEKEPKLFVSYTHQDADLARKLRRALGKLGIETFEDAGYAGHVGAELEKKLRVASCYVVLVSDKSVNSPNVNFEIGAAIGLEKKLIPVFLTRHARRDAPAPLRTRVGIFAEHMSPDDIAARIVGSIEREAA